MNYLDFDIEEYEQDGVKFIRYLIDGQIVSKDIWNKIKQDRKEKLQSIITNNINNKQDNINHKEEVCDCDKCNFIRDIIDELEKCNEKQKFQFLFDIISQTEEESFIDGIHQGIESGSKQILKHFVEEMNQIIYAPMDIEFVVSGDMEDDDEEY